MATGKGRRIAGWAAGAVVVLALAGLALFGDLPVMLHPGLPHLSFFSKCFYILLIASACCLIRIVIGPTAADRAVAIDILGILVIGFCAIVSIPTGRTWYMDIGIAWGLQSFIASIALAKYLEGRDLDE